MKKSAYPISHYLYANSLKKVVFVQMTKLNQYNSQFLEKIQLKVSVGKGSTVKWVGLVLFCIFPLFPSYHISPSFPYPFNGYLPSFPGLNMKK